MSSLKSGSKALKDPAFYGQALGAAARLVRFGVGYNPATSGGLALQSEDLAVDTTKFKATDVPVVSLKEEADLVEAQAIRLGDVAEMLVLG